MCGCQMFGCILRSEGNDGFVAEAAREVWEAAVSVSVSVAV